MKVKVRSNGDVVRPYHRTKDTEVEDALLEIEAEQREWEKEMEDMFYEGDDEDYSEDMA